MPTLFPKNDGYVAKGSGSLTLCLSTRRKPVIDALRENVAALLAQGYELEAAMQELAQSQLRKNTSQCWTKYFSCIRWYPGSHAEEQLRRIDYQG